MAAVGPPVIIDDVPAARARATVLRYADGGRGVVRRVTMGAGRHEGGGVGAWRRVGRMSALATSGMVLLVVGVAGAANAPMPGARPPASVFHIAKSENRNQVHYGVRVDEDCRPVGATPVYGYWRDFEVGPNAKSQLLDREQPAYGLTRPRFVEQRDEGGTVSIGLRGFPDRSIRIETFREGSGCRARALTKIGGQVAVLNTIYVELGLLFSIDFVIVRGLRLPDGRPIQEKVDE